MANNFLTFKGFNVGKSLIENNSEEIVNKIFFEAKKYNCKIFIPEDCNVATHFDGSASTKKQNAIDKNEMILYRS